MLKPTTPPVDSVPRTTPETVQPEMSPLSPLLPATPPTFSAALTTPEKLQFSIVPRFSPAMPPTRLWLPLGITSPSTRRFLTEAPAPMRLKSPRSEALRVMRRP